MSGFIDMFLAPDAMKVISAFSKADQRAIAMFNRTLRKITSLFLRETQKSFETKTQPGGAAWEPNYGDEPGGYAWFKREILKLADPSTGYVNGELRNSMGQELELYPSLVSRVGTPKQSGKEYSEGGTSGQFFVKDHSGRWWRFPGGDFPGRPFLPATDWAESKAAEIMREEMRAFAEADWNRTVGSIIGAAGDL